MWWVLPLLLLLLLLLPFEVGLDVTVDAQVGGFGLIDDGGGVVGKETLRVGILDVRKTVGKADVLKLWTILASSCAKGGPSNIVIRPL